MKNNMSLWSIVVTAIGTAFTWWLGYWDAVIQLVLYIMILDFITGVMYAVMTKTFNRQKALYGLLTKLLYLFIIGLGVRVDILNLYPAPIARTALAWGIVVIETGSVLGNFDRLGIPVPDFLKKIFNTFKEKL